MCGREQVHEQLRDGRAVHRGMSEHISRERTIGGYGRGQVENADLGRGLRGEQQQKLKCPCKFCAWDLKGSDGSGLRPGGGSQLKVVTSTASASTART